MCVQLFQALHFGAGRILIKLLSPSKRLSGAAGQDRDQLYMLLQVMSKHVQSSLMAPYGAGGVTSSATWEQEVRTAFDA